MLDFRDLLELPAKLRRRPRVAWDERPPEGVGVALASDPAVRPRVVLPPEPVAPAELVTMNTVGATVERPNLDPSSIDPRVTAPALEAPAFPQKQMGVVGVDVDPATAGMGVRPRIADPLEYRRHRVEEMEAEPAAKSHHSRLYEAGAGAWRGFRGGGLLGAIVGAGVGAVNPDAVAGMRQREELAREQGRYADLYKTRKAQADLEGEQISNQARAATIPYLLARPELEADKLDSLDTYRAGQLKVRRDANESLEDYRNRTLGMRQDANESLDEYRDRMIKLGERRAAQGDRRLTESERHNRVDESLGGERVRQGDERIGLAREGLTLRERIANGNLDAAWARIGQGYDRLDEGRKAKVDALAEKAAKAQAEAEYFAGQSGKEAEAKLKRDEAEGYRRQAEGIQNRPAPRVSRPPVAARTPPVGEEDFVNAARQRLGASFDEQKAREAYRRRYGR
jgi:hypothetical protein